MTESAATVLRRFGPMVYLPTLLFSLGEGAFIPLIPVIATKLGADVAVAAAVSAAIIVGQLCGNLPAGWLVSRIGERRTMLLSGLVALLGALAAAMSPSLGLFAAAVFVMGFATAAFGLARHAFMAQRVPLAFRGRALALLGGSFRLGMFVGPFVAALLLFLFGTETAALWFFGALLVAMLILVTFGPDPEETTPLVVTAPTVLVGDSGEPTTGSLPVTGPIGVIGTLRHHRGVLSRLGFAAACLAAVRTARQVVLPLWGLSLGLDAQTIALVVGVAGAIDFALFYASGQVMDRFGRLWAALPATLLMGAGFLALAFTHEADTAVLWYGMVAAVVAVGNGVSSGILLTLGADLAPKLDPAPFLSAWRTLTDAGGAIAPLIVSGLAAAASLPVACGAMGVLGMLGAGAFLRWIPRYIPRTER